MNNIRALSTANVIENHALVAQLDRVLGYEPSGRRFESFRVRHMLKPEQIIFVRVFSF